MFLYAILSGISFNAGRLVLKVITYFGYESLKQFRISFGFVIELTIRQSRVKTTFESDGKFPS